jgi:hypothetical protein
MTHYFYYLSFLLHVSFIFVQFVFSISEAIEKLLSAESLHSIAYCLSEDEGFDLASRLGISALTVSKILIMYGSVENKNFRLFLLWKKGIKGDVSDIKDFINTFYDIERGDIALGITDALEKCQHFKK